MAEDFSQAFGLGEDERYINMVDADGVALAAIQGLHQLVQEQADQITRQQLQITELQTRLLALENAIQAQNSCAP
jgi:hypothetical protein